jgi:hypothetical protein
MRERVAKFSEERLYTSSIRRLSRPFCDPGQHGMVAKSIESVEVHNRELLPVLTSFVRCRTLAETRADLGMDDRSSSRAPLRSKVLYTSFATGQAIPATATHLSVSENSACSNAWLALQRVATATRDNPSVSIA